MHVTHDDPTAILARMTPAERAEAETEALAKGISVEELVARAVATLIWNAESMSIGAKDGTSGDRDPG